MNFLFNFDLISKPRIIFFDLKGRITLFASLTSVSFKLQEFNSSIESQKQQLLQNGIEDQNIRVEVGSAANEIKNRPVFQKLMQEELQANDLLMVTKIDRCS